MKISAPEIVKSS